MRCKMTDLLDGLEKRSGNGPNGPPSGDADTIHYFSVKPHGGNAKGNYLNDGAVGTNIRQ